MNTPTPNIAPLTLCCPWSKKGPPKFLAKVESVLETIPILPLDMLTDTEYGNIRTELEAAVQIIGANNLLIGGTKKVSHW